MANNKKLFIVFTPIIVIIISSCGQRTEKGTLNYSTLNYDTTKVVFFKWDTSEYMFPKNSDPLFLTQSDLFIAGSLLKNALDTFNLVASIDFYLSFNKVIAIDSFRIDFKKYKTQFFPYRDVNGERIISIIGFNDIYPAWKTRPYYGRYHYGIRKFDLKINLSSKSHENIQTGSYG